MEQRKHWWNGKSGRLARTDVFVRTDADQWHVERRVGGAGGDSRRYEFDSEDQAYELVRALLAGPHEWQELATQPARRATTADRATTGAADAGRAGR